jgi:hypothetical protein
MLYIEHELRFSLSQTSACLLRVKVAGVDEFLLLLPFKADSGCENAAAEGAGQQLGEEGAMLIMLAVLVNLIYWRMVMRTLVHVIVF